MGSEVAIPNQLDCRDRQRNEPARIQDVLPTSARMMESDPAGWNREFAGSEHPETARLRLAKQYIDTITALKRENMDRTYIYLTTLIDKAKEELNHSRTSNSDHRRALLQQHIDELSTYLAGFGITPPLPGKYDERHGKAMQGSYILDEIPAFFGAVKFLIDEWYTKNLGKVHDDVASLMNFRRQPQG